MASIMLHLRAIARVIGSRILRAWKWYRTRRPRLQIVIAIAVAIALFLLASLGGGNKPTEGTSSMRTVTLASVSALSGNGPAGSVLGTVRSVTEAELLSEAAGTVVRVNTTLGSNVPAGFVIAELENAAARAAVLQAEGAYDAAVATRASVSPVDAETSARNAYRTAFTSLDTALEDYIDTFFGAQTPSGPALLINPGGSDPTTLSRKRATIDHAMDAWRNELPSADAQNAETLLSQAAQTALEIQAFTEALAEAANRTNSRATSAQLAALSAGRSAVNGVLASLNGALASYRSNSTSSTASVDAGVKAALGTLRLAQANLERTIVRAPISGTVNFLPIRIGDYVTNLMHVATVAQNGALEVVASVSEDVRASLTVNMPVTVEGTRGVITSIAPALDPITKQIEVRIAVDAGSSLLNGQSVRITLPTIITAAATTSSTGPVLLPLAAVKLAADSRVVFTIDADSKLVALPVSIGEVRGDRIEITSPLEVSTLIVTDARGLASGQEVKVAP